MVDRPTSFSLGASAEGKVARAVSGGSIPVVYMLSKRELVVLL